MKLQYVTGLAEGVRVESTFVLRSKEMRSTRSGDAYLALELADRTGVMPAVWFRPDAAGVSVPAGAVVRVTGRVTTFRSVKRISIEALTPASRYEPEDMLAAGPGDRESVIEQFRALAGTVKGAELRKVLRAVFGNEALFSRFVACPASELRHHAYLGGLIAHSLAVGRICDSLAGLYEQVDRDLLVTAALMHDIGKIDELSWETGISLTDEGRLIGHVVLGERIVHAAVSRLRSPVHPALMARLSHAMLSHHGELEWGSPKRPATLEALLLHHADNMDAKATGFTELIAGASALDERWTDAQNLFRRPLYAPSLAENERPGRIEEGAFELRVPA